MCANVSVSHACIFLKDTTTMKLAESPSHIRRAQALSASLILSVGLAVFASAEQEHVSWLAPMMALIPVAMTWWVLDLRPQFEREHGEVYSLFLLPIVLYVGGMFFLQGLVNGDSTFFWEFRRMSTLDGTIRLLLVVLPTSLVFYLLFISIHAIDLYRHLPYHVARIILNVFTLMAAYVVFIFIYQFPFSIALRPVIVYLASWLLFFQGLFWWSNGSIRYSLYYSSFNSLLLSMLSVTVSLWPFGYLVTGFMMMLALYVLLGITQHYFKRTLTWMVVGEHLALSIFLMAALLSQTRWMPVGN